MKGNVSRGWHPICELRGCALHFGYVLFLQMYISYIQSGKNKATVVHRVFPADNTSGDVLLYPILLLFFTSLLWC